MNTRDETIVVAETSMISSADIGGAFDVMEVVLHHHDPASTAATIAASAAKVQQKSRQ